MKVHALRTGIKFLSYREVSLTSVRVKVRTYMKAAPLVYFREVATIVAFFNYS